MDPLDPREGPPHEPSLLALQSMQAQGSQGFPVPGRPPFWRALLVLLLPLCAWLAQGILLPGLDREGVQQLVMFGSGSSASSFSVVALGLAPIVTGFFLVELAAWLVPRWRPLRAGDLESRRRLRRAALLLSLVLSLLQGFFVSRWLLASSARVPMSDAELLSPGLGAWFVPLAMLSLTAGVCLMVGLAHAIERHALGAGFSLLTAALALVHLVESGWAALRHGGWPEVMVRTPLDLMLGALLVVGALAGLAAVLQRPVRARRGPSIRLPSCGLVPLVAAASILMLPATLAPLFNWRLPPDLAAMAPGTWTFILVYAALALAFAVPLSSRFSRPDADDEQDPEAQRAALSVSVAVLLGLGAASQLGSHFLGTAIDLAVLAALPAVALDLAAEWRLRSSHGELVAIRACPRLPAASAALERLQDAGIPAIVRGLHHRSLWHFFAPHLEMVLLVPTHLAETAERVLRGEHRDASHGPEHPPGRRPVALPRRALFVLAACGLVAGALSFLRYGLPLLASPGLRLIYRVEPDRDSSLDGPRALAASAEVVRSRLVALHGRATVRIEGDRLLVELPRLDAEESARHKALIALPARLGFYLVDDDSEYMRRIAVLAESQRGEPQRAEGAVRADLDVISGPDGKQHGGPYLMAADRAALFRFFEGLPQDLAVPTDRALLIESVQGSGEEGDIGPAFRTHLVERTPILGNSELARAEVMADKFTARPEVAIEFTPKGARIFEDFTAANIGRRLAIAVDDEVSSAPTIMGRIGGGHARITLGGNKDARALLQDAKELVAALSGGALPARLVLEREKSLSDR